MAALDFGSEPVTGTALTLDNDGTSVAAYFARPEHLPNAGLVVATDIGGIRPLFADMCDRLASHGLAVVAVEPFTRRPDVREKAPADRLLDVKDLDDAEQVGDLVVAAAYLRDTTFVTRVSVLGFCMGGMYALKGAASGAFDRAVSCYGMIRLPADWHGAGQQDALDTASDVCPTLAIFGEDDPFTPVGDVDALRHAWGDLLDCEVVVVPRAEHGFIHDPDRPAHLPEQARAAWHQILHFVG